MACLVDGSSKTLASTTPKDERAAWAESAPRNAARRTLRFTLTSKFVRGRNAEPPPVHWDARIVPARARPVPFWRHGFPRPPATRPRVLSVLLPPRRELSSARTVSWTRCGFTSAPKTEASSDTSFDRLPAASRRATLGAATPLLPHLDDAVRRPGHGSLDEQEILLGVDRVDRKADLGHALASQAAGHLHPFEDTCRIGGRTDRAGLAHVVRAV